jgi:hypothetical protein
MKRDGAKLKQVKGKTGGGGIGGGKRGGSGSGG